MISLEMKWVLLGALILKEEVLPVNDDKAIAVTRELV